MKRMKKAVLNKAEGRTAHKFQFELTLTKVGALDRVLKGLDGSTLFVQATRGPKVVVSARATAAANAVSWAGDDGATPLSFVCTLYTSKKAEAAFSEKKFRIGLMLAQALE